MLSPLMILPDIAKEIGKDIPSLLIAELHPVWIAYKALALELRLSVSEAT